MNGIDLKRAVELEREHHYAMELEWDQPYVNYGRIQRREHGRCLTRLAVIHVCRTVLEGELWGISTNAFSKRIGRRYHRLREARGIPPHVRPKLTVRCMEELIAFIREIPRDIRYADALEGVFICCIEYWESGLERCFRLGSSHPGDWLVDPPDIPEGW